MSGFPAADVEKALSIANFDEEEMEAIKKALRRVYWAARNDAATDADENERIRRGEI